MPALRRSVPRPPSGKQALGSEEPSPSAAPAHGDVAWGQNAGRAPGAPRPRAATGGARAGSTHAPAGGQREEPRPPGGLGSSLLLLLLLFFLLLLLLLLVAVFFFPLPTHPPPALSRRPPSTHGGSRLAPLPTRPPLPLREQRSEAAAARPPARRPPQPPLSPQPPGAVRGAFYGTRRGVCGPRREQVGEGWQARLGSAGPSPRRGVPGPPLGRPRCVRPSAGSLRGSAGSETVRFLCLATAWGLPAAGPTVTQAVARSGRAGDPRPLPPLLSPAASRVFCVRVSGEVEGVADAVKTRGTAGAWQGPPLCLSQPPDCSRLASALLRFGSPVPTLGSAKRE